jgi:hypothetical protein
MNLFSGDELFLRRGPRATALRVRKGQARVHLLVNPVNPSDLLFVRGIMPEFSPILRRWSR